MASASLKVTAPSIKIPVTITYKLSSGISPTLYSFVPVLALLFIVAYGAWGAYLTLRSSGYSKGAIYR